MPALRFPAIARDIITKIEETQSEALTAAADLYARAIANDGLVHLWGGGHSALGVLETFPRIGLQTNVPSAQSDGFDWILSRSAHVHLVEILDS